MAKDSFLLYYEWEDNLSDLTDGQLGSLLRALFSYEKRGEQYAGDDPEVRMAFRFVKGTLDRNREKYDARVEQCKEAGKRSGEARKGKKKTGNKKAKMKGEQAPTDVNERQRTPTKRTVHVPVHVHVPVPVQEREGASLPTHARAKEQTDPQSQKVQWAENVTMTVEEHEKLEEAHGAADTALMVEHLSRYKAAHRKEYAGGDYRAIQSWVVNWLKEQKAREAKAGGRRAGNAPAPMPQSEPAEEQERRMLENERWMRKYLEEAEKAEQAEQTERRKDDEDGQDV